MGDDMYSVEQVADRLGLHVRTVRGYIRSGRLKAVRIGKQYRIARADLAALLGRPDPPRRAVEVSTVVEVDGVDGAGADRLGTLVLASVGTAPDAAHPLRVQTLFDEERNRMKIVVFGGPAATADVLHLIAAVLDADNGLFAGEVDGG
ncbi:helix-turn-helix domain-containing protein [Saccharothrix variisporea]|nr:helix-turn-helix domain-containing protein [Saccharothrix variisporea]